MKRKWSKTLKNAFLVGTLSLSMIGAQMVNPKLCTQAATISQNSESYVEANFYLLKKGCSRPTGTGAQPVGNYISVGKGFIHSKTEIGDNDKAVADIIAKAPDCSAYLAKDEMVVWYVVKEAAKNKWNVDGEIVKIVKETTEPTIKPTKQPVSCGFQVMKVGEERPATLDVSNTKFDWGNFGYITEGKEVCNNPEVVNNMVVKVPADVSKLLQENESIEWFSVKKVGYSWRIYGEIYNEKVENSKASYNDTDYLKVDTIKDMEKIDEKLKVGTIIETSGFYEKGDGGAAKYEISFRSNKTNFMTFTTQTGQYANYVIEGDSINVKQLGAGVCEQITYNTSVKENNDDAQRINEAITYISNVGGGTIYFPEGEYRCADKIHVRGTNYTLKGEGSKSVLYTDNGYKGKDEHFITISGATNVGIDGLRVEARETKWVAYYRQCSVMFSTGITIKNSEFLVHDNVIAYDGNTDRQYTNITLYSAWHDVLVDNCVMEQMGCVERGACVGVIDMWNNKSTNATITHCTMKQNAHDEMIGIFTTSKDTAGIDGVHIANNNMYTTSASNVSKKTMAITVSYDVSKNLKNVVIENNYVKAEIPTNFMTFGTIENCRVSGNTFDIVKTSGSGVIFDTRKGVTIENNNIQISSVGNGNLAHIFKRYGVFKNNTVNCDCHVYSFMYQGGKAYDNRVTMTAGCDVIAISPEEVIGNTFYIDGYVKNFISYDSISYDSTIANNEFNYMYDDTKEAQTMNVWSGSYAVYAGFHAAMHDNTVTFVNNTINAPNCAATNKHLLGYGVGDSTPQNFVIENNKVGKYTGVRSFYGAWGNITFENNTNTENQVIQLNDVKITGLEKYR